MSTRSPLLESRTLLAPLTLGFLVLAPDPAIALDRDRVREVKTVAEQWIWLANVIRAELGGVGLWIDTRAADP